MKIPYRLSKALDFLKRMNGNPFMIEEFANEVYSDISNEFERILKARIYLANLRKKKDKEGNIIGPRNLINLRKNEYGLATIDDIEEVLRKVRMENNVSEGHEDFSKSLTDLIVGNMEKISIDLLLDALVAIPTSAWKKKNLIKDEIKKRTRKAIEK